MIEPLALFDMALYIGTSLYTTPPTTPLIVNVSVLVTVLSPIVPDMFILTAALSPIVVPLAMAIVHAPVDTSAVPVTPVGASKVMALMAMPCAPARSDTLVKKVQGDVVTPFSSTVTASISLSRSANTAASPSSA